MRRRITKSVSPSPALARLGPAIVPSFFGREAELAALGRALAEPALIVVRGAVGAGKSRLVEAMAGAPELLAGRRVVLVRCEPGDRAGALVSRAERALDALPGTLTEVLATEAVVLVVDDAHKVAGGEAPALWSRLGGAADAGRVVLVTREALPLCRGGRRLELAIEGLDAAAGRELWAELEERFGPTPAGSCDAALARTRGMPLALRRDYARARFGEHAWSMGELEAPLASVLEALATLRVEVAPAAIAAVLPALAGEVGDALARLVELQLVDVRPSGRFAMHEVVREQVLVEAGARRRAELSARAAAVIASSARGDAGHARLSWDAGDDGACGLLHPIDRLAWAVGHCIDAGELRAGLELLGSDEAAALCRGGAHELVAIADRLEAAGLAPGELAVLRAELAIRRGEVAVALEGAAGLDPVEAAILGFRSGESAVAADRLAALGDGDDGEQRGRAAAALAEVELGRGRASVARAILLEAFERDGGGLSAAARCRLHLAFAAIEAADGHGSAARAALCRAASSARGDAVTTAEIEARRVVLLLREGRVDEASSVLDAAIAAARAVDAVSAADELCLGRALLARRGELAAAGDRADSAASLARSRGLDGFGARAALVLAEVELGAGRSEVAQRRLEAIAAADVGGRARSAAVALAAIAAAGPDTELATPACAEDAAEIALRHGDGALALERARDAAVRAERGGRPGDLARALALAARLELSRGDRAAAATAARAAREARTAGATRARALALLVLAASARDDDDPITAAAYARDALELAVGAGLPVERLAASRAAEVLADGGAGTSSGAPEVAPSAEAVTAAERLLADLGLTAERPFRIVHADGSDSYVADASHEQLRVAERELVIDGVRELIVRQGEVAADLRRRSLLKRLLFLFAASPGRVFSKEEIVVTVWELDYHPLRHDAALFTNIMRIRRLLGDDGAELLRVSEDGYRFLPAPGYVFVSRAS